MQKILQTTANTKKIILEGSDRTKRTMILLLISGACLLTLLALSYIGISNSWLCELDNTDPKYNYICKQLRKDITCANIAGPLQIEIILDINNEVKASGLIVCPWENAISEIRICFILGAILVVFIGIVSVTKEDKKMAELHINSAYFFSLLLAIAGTFDLYAVQDSIVDNYSLCTLTNEYAVQNDIKSERMNCTYGLYKMTGYTGYLCSLTLIIAAFQIKEWKLNLAFNR